MRVRICLQRVLKDYKIPEHGVVSSIAREVKLDRDWVTKVRDGVQQKIPLAKLSSLCLWLIRKGVPAHVLPHVLFDRGEVREAIDQSGTVEFYLGQKCTLESLRSDSPADVGRFFTRKWLASDDVEAWSDITTDLSLYRHVPQFRTICVPYHVTETGQPQREQKDRFEAGERFDKLIKSKDTSHILIGSPRANLLTEHLVAHVFGQDGFVAPKRRGVPFYFRYRPGPGPSALTSCMGGIQSHPLCPNGEAPGVYYLNEKLKWECAGWTSDKQDAGVILSLQFAESKRITVALMGYSGRATRWAAHAFLQDSEQFRPTLEQGNRRVGVYVCHFADGQLVHRVNLINPRETRPRPRRQSGARSPAAVP
jgi:hypothetical protein